MSLRPSNSCIRPTVRYLLSATRSFSITPRVLAGNPIPPESPAYIKLPSPPQSEEVTPERVRGRLPIPRDIFPRREGDRKVRPGYIEQTAPISAKDSKPTTKLQEWKAKVASSRRANLEQGLNALWSRRVKSDKISRARATQKFGHNRAAAEAPEPEDDRLTRGTVLQSMLDTKVYTDPERFVRADRGRSKTQAREAIKQQKRRDALMELYISATNFIVDEKELKTEIDKIFADDYFKKMGQAMGRYGTMENTWGVYGNPPTIASMMESATGSSSKYMDHLETEYDRSVKRQKRIAEEFTGGKME